jgi:hypothetical protein
MVADAAPADAQVTVHVHELKRGSTIWTGERPRHLPDAAVALQCLYTQVGGPPGNRARAALRVSPIDLIDRAPEKYSFFR